MSSSIKIIIQTANISASYRVVYSFRQASMLLLLLLLSLKSFKVFFCLLLNISAAKHSMMRMTSMFKHGIKLLSLLLGPMFIHLIMCWVLLIIIKLLD